MDISAVYITLAAAFALFMAWGIGANDVANAMATSVGSRAITIKQAIIIAAIFEFLGAILAGGEVTGTIRKGIVDADAFASNPDTLVWGMLGALLAAASWLAIASKNGWPVSTTHSIVGAVVGFAAVGIGIDAVNWGKVGTIALSWIVSPMLAGTLAYLIFGTLQRLIINTENPFEQAKRYAPVYIFLVFFIISLLTIKKGLKHLNFDVSSLTAFSLAIFTGITCALVGVLITRKIKLDPKANKAFHYASVEKVFGALMIFTASAMAFAHGSNDVANAVGPVAAIVGVVDSGMVSQKSSLPVWVLLLGGGGIVIGLATFGFRVIKTVGQKITELTPTRGFSAELAASSTVVLASFTGIPISTTHTLVGAVLGVGMARGIAALNIRVVGKIFMSWIVTLPVGAVFAILFFYLFKGIFVDY